MAILIGYLIIGLIVFLITAYFLFRTLYEIRKDGFESAYEEIEMKGSGCICAIVAVLAGVLWPAFPLILAGVYLYEKIQEKHPELCGLEDLEEEE